MIVFAALTAALAVFVGVYTLASPARPRAIANRLGQWDRESSHDREAMLAAPFATRVGQPVASRVRRFLSRLLPSSMVNGIEARLLQAGEPVALQPFLAMQLAAVGIGVVWIVFGVAGGASGILLLVVLASGLAISVLPLYWLRLKVMARKKAILKALPDAVDLIVTTVEAGLAIDAALAEVGHETRGPLGEELRLTVRETTLGRSRRDALLRLIDRTQVPELKTFVQAIVQAEQTGIPIGQVLRTQAAQIRLKKRQWAESEAQRAPVKMIIVLVVLVLPCMLMMIMGPAIMRIQDTV
jgi:tight adherence protein C